MASDDAVQEIKRRVDLAQVVGRYVKLKRQGRSYVGLCPFHREKTPSLFVHPDEGFFKCFGCDAKGDVFSFLERQTGQAFIDILKQLAEETGVELEERQESPEQQRRRKERKRLLQVLALAQTWFRNRLQGDDGGGARKYLAETRKVPAEWVELFALGFGGARDDGLLTFLTKEGVDVEEAKRAGVLAEGHSGPYDFFHRRVTFPIRDVRGDVVTFAGRAFGEGADKRPKYVNGPASPVYDKSRVLYGLYESLPALKRGKAGVLVEGQLDVLAVHRAGVRSGFAPCGTSLTEAHVGELKRYSERVVVCMDADAAGRAAAERAILMLLKAGFDVSWARLLEKDPDEMVRSGEQDALRSAIEGAPAALDVLIDDAKRDGAGSARDRVRAIDRLLPFLAAPPRELTRRQFVRAAAEALREDERLLWDEVEQRGKQELQKRTRRDGPPAARAQEAASSSERERRDTSGRDEGRALVPTRARKRRPAPRWTEAEKLLAEALIAHPLLVPRCGVLLEGLRNPEVKDFIERLSDALVRYHDWEPHKVLLEHVHARRGSALFDILAEFHRRKGFDEPSRIISEHAAAEAIDDYLLRFDARPLRERLREVQRAMAEAERSDELDEWKRLQGLQRVLVDDLRPPERLEERPRPARAALDAAPTPPTPPLLEEPEPPPAPVVELHPPAPAPSPSDGWGPSAGDDPAWDDDGWDEPV